MGWVCGLSYTHPSLRGVGWGDWLVGFGWKRFGSLRRRGERAPLHDIEPILHLLLLLNGWITNHTDSDHIQLAGSTRRETHTR
jgi:hypothetical protein